MPLTIFLTEVFGVLTVALVLLLIILGLFFIYRSLYLHIRILKRDFIHLVYFNGPWLARIFLVLVTIWWGFWETLRLTFLKEKFNLFSNVTLQKNVCKYYLLSNIGFAEPIMFLTLMSLLHASLQNSESKRSNRKIILYVMFFASPIFLLQLGLVFVGPKFNDKANGRRMVAKYFIDSCSMVNERSVCLYPLISTSFIALLYFLLILYAVYIGRKMLSLVINRGLRKRVYWLISLVFIVLPLRTSLLALSAFLHPGGLVFEAVVFLAFCTLFISAFVCIFVLVYYPIADSLALRDLGQIEFSEMPYDDYFHESASLVANRSNVDAGRSSDTSTFRGSISFRTMVRNEPSTLQSLEETYYNQIASSSISPSPSSRPMLPLVDIQSL